MEASSVFADLCANTIVYTNITELRRGQISENQIACYLHSYSMKIGKEFLLGII